MSLKHQDQEFMWEQKYRGTTLDEIALPVAMREELTRYKEAGNLPHLLLDSPSPGTGKTTTALVAAYMVGCPRPMVVNASSDTDIGNIRTNVTRYASGSSLTSRGHKVVILDEVDRLSTAAQEALKGIMESVSHICSFILTTNHIYRISDQLASRCTKLQFTFTAEDRKICAMQMCKRSMQILDAEEVTYDKRVIAKIVQACVPDNRRIVKTLQQMSSRYGEVGVSALGDLERGDLAALCGSIKLGNYAEVLQWVTDNSTTVTGVFYRDLYDSLKPMITPQSVAELIITLGEEQKAHATTPNMFLHLARLLTLVMGAVQFK